jgi:hypothetical protein
MSEDTDLTERRRILDEGVRLRAEADDLDDRGRWREAGQLRDRYIALSHRYADLLPEVTVARCPESGRVVRWRMDTAGLDGWFWDYRLAVHRTASGLPRLWLAMTGAMRLAEPVEHTAHLAVPGPGVPYALPRLLDKPGVRLVIAEVPVGRHTGWALSYFGPRPDGVNLVNRWGADSYNVYEDDGTWSGWASNVELAEDFDFDLRRWLDAGKAFWIAPGDPSATLREGSGNCPYVDLTGPRKVAHVWRGEIAYAA